MVAGIAHARATPLDQALADIAACRDYLAPRGKVFIVGYCYGGSLAWLAAGKVEGLSGASSYYGSMVQANAELKPMCPTIVHLGRLDAGIPADEVKAAVQARSPACAGLHLRRRRPRLQQRGPGPPQRRKRRSRPRTHPGAVRSLSVAVGETLRLTSPLDGFDFAAYRAPAQDARRGGLVLIQEIFGVTEHIRELADGFAAEGYEALAPVASTIAASPASRRGMTPIASPRAGRFPKPRPGTRWPPTSPPPSPPSPRRCSWSAIAGAGRRPGWRPAACEGVAAASCFYGRRIPELVAETPRCPIILHFGRTDPTIPPPGDRGDRRRPPRPSDPPL